MARKTSAAGNKGKPAGRAARHDLGLLPSPDSVRGQHYYYVAQRFWPSLVFILPMLVLFEVGTYLRRGGFQSEPPQLVAAFLIEKLVNVFGAGGFYFPGLLVIVILLACHIAAKQPWRFDVWVLAGMLGESLFWTLPLFVLDQVLHTALVAGADTAAGAWLDQVIRSFGAGIYEELVFRFICMNLLSILLVDLGKLPRSPANALIIVASALIFAAQHHPPLGAEPFDSAKFLFRAAAGLYLAGLYFFRGFGIAAGCHCFYNVIVVTIGAVQS